MTSTVDDRGADALGPDLGGALAAPALLRRTAPEVPARAVPAPADPVLADGVVPPGGTDAGDPTAGRDDEARRARRAATRRYVALLALPLLVGAALRLGLALGDQVITNDASAYLQSGRNLVEGRGFVRTPGTPELHFPPGTPLLLGGTWRLTGSPLVALTSVTFLASTLCLLPLAGLARRLGGDRAGLAACWVGALAPGLSVVPVNAGGGSEAVHLLFLLTLLWLVATLRSREGLGVWATAAGAGLAAGALYLTRPEGLLLVLPVLAAVVLTSGVVGDLRRREVTARGLLRRSAPAGVLLAVLVACMAPYVVHLHRHTGSWELTAKSQDANIEAWRAVADGDRRARDRVLYELDDSGLGLVERSTSLPGLVADDPGGYAGIVGTNGTQLWSEYVAPRPSTGSWFPSWVLLPLPLLGVALWGAWRHRRDPLVLALVGVAALATATCLGFFVQSRYLVPATGALCVLAGLGLAGLRPRWRAGAAVVAALLLVVPLVAEAGRDPGGFATREPVEHQVAGEWLARNTAADSRVMTRSLVTAFYAQRVALAPPFASLDETLRYARHHGVDHLVVDEFLMYRFRPQLTPLLGPGPWPGLRLEHAFHERGRLTRIFALDPAPTSDSPDPPPLGFVGDG